MVSSRLDSGWRVISASVAGPNHASVGVENQDSMRTGVVGKGLHLLAIADGAGSQPRAAHGSRLSVDAARDAADRVFPVAPRTLAEWRAASHRFAAACLAHFDDLVDRALTPLRARPTATGANMAARAEFATTLLALVADPPFYAYVCVGDGFLVMERVPGGSHLVLPPPSGRDTASETVFMTSPGRERDLRYGVVVDTAVCGIALCTDGLIDGLLDATRASDGRTHLRAPEDFDAYFAAFRAPGVDGSELSRKLQSREFAASSGDDKTMVLAVRK
ncbi:protein phosphatase 2C domain-containing protein [Actinoplanes sp. LDG1-06]|uniref:Protein phosphatase 2C domain-containing protein n=1 Tax=Paractinoplanes ovalisporus TaxID=2810368 RepID=A0ABS2AM74_9ACTN|nr:protein phosphatase 2C domain-containing protein [Actinoplanes ovalisporus]MBM2620936.1 protein phosphatase 2C domain-containing protein [Actinoplanes ovalisporus]